MSTTTAVRIAYDCPPWCERPDHEVDDLSSGEDPYHYGPDFGAFIGVMALGAAHPLGTVDDGDNRDDLTSGDLRQLAVDAVAAAEWLAQRDHEAGTCHLSEWSCSHCEARQ